LRHFVLQPVNLEVQYMYCTRLTPILA